MNHYINYYYNIYPESIREQNKQIYFNYNNELYYFLIFDRPVEDANYLYELNIEMIRRGSLVHEIILNKDKNILTFVNDIPYILMRVYININKKSDLSEITFISINNANIKTNRTLDRTDWVTLWSTKVDYLEYQISQVGKKYPIICEYFSYYIGLAENAISYAKNTHLDLKKSEYDVLTIAHKRIKTKDTAFDLYNPLSFIIDYQIRDLSEYIKTQFFSGADIWPELDNFFQNYDVPLFSKRLLYARLLFPSYFFDVYEAIVEEKLKEDDILPIVYKAEEYENFLIEFHTFINRGNLMPQIDWLIKKNSF
jgi:spore coat protein YutH